MIQNTIIILLTSLLLPLVWVLILILFKDRKTDKNINNIDVFYEEIKNNKK